MTKVENRLSGSAAPDGGAEPAEGGAQLLVGNAGHGLGDAAGLGGIGRRPLRRMLMEARVPRSDRPGYPVVARGETILWVPGICRSADDLPRPGTRAVRVDVTKHGEPQADGRA